MSDIKVSTIIPTYKRPDRLKETIDSVLSQILQDQEVIVVDDNNPDTEYRKETEAMMKAYENDPRVVYIRHEQNKNGAAARNTGLRAAKGTYIAFLDDDDIFFPEKNEKEAEFLDTHPEFQAVYCGRIQKGRVIRGKYEGNLTRDILLQTFTPTTSALMFRREALEKIGGFDESFRRHQDYELMLKFFDAGMLIGAVKEPLLLFGVNDGENELHGKELEKNKKQFLNTFKNVILDIDQYDHGFKNAVLRVNYRFVFTDHLSQGYFKRALYIYKAGCKNGFLAFNAEIIRYFLYYTKVKATGIIRRALGK